MSFDQNPLTRIDIHTLTGVNVNNLERSKTFDFHRLVAFQSITDQVEYLVGKVDGIFLAQSVLLCQSCGNLLNRDLSHYSFPPFFTRSFQLAFGLKFSTSLGGTSIR